MSTQIAKATAAATEAHAGIGDEYLTFSLGDEEYAVDILKVQEIRGYENVTRLPDSPDFIKGVINLRGVIVPIVDLRLKFELGKAEYNELTVMIILNLGSRVVGIVVDSVSDVVRLPGEQIKPSPDLGGAVDTRFLKGVATVSERMLLLLDIERMMLGRDMALTDAAA
jgi:purine-binding chemotaxis protein CheW